MANDRSDLTPNFSIWRNRVKALLLGTVSFFLLGQLAHVISYWGESGLLIRLPTVLLVLYVAVGFMGLASSFVAIVRYWRLEAAKARPAMNLAVGSAFLMLAFFWHGVSSVPDSMFAGSASRLVVVLCSAIAAWNIFRLGRRIARAAE